MIVLDTGPLYAAADSDDKHHQASVALLRTNEELVLPSPVIVEVCYWMSKRLGPHVEAAFLRTVAAGAFTVTHPDGNHLVRAAELITQYADNNLGFVDAVVMATAERLNAIKVATVDHRHFRAVRPLHVSAFYLLP